ncbi:metallopeptidase family protein [Nocardioides sp. AE5]|uniref:metallopeptidase family protein n=1 Tax=Nocardioides sp. AE5 TaxID=2962573 RepID=UPI0028814CB5|nr:metallopeptidase family protein [Nocardioides sp. AE5]MDT0202106.1 metallopeptidase family protein [Nocardioides sp. AE5]
MARARDRHGRGPRGPEILPPRSPGGLRARRRPTRRERFDALVLGVVAEIEERWQRHLGLVEYAVEDTPLVPDDWDDDSVPLSSLIRQPGHGGTRLVVFRRPIEHRCSTREELEALVLTVIVEQVAELLGLPAERIDPRYPRDED